MNKFIHREIRRIVVELENGETFTFVSAQGSTDMYAKVNRQGHTLTFAEKHREALVSRVTLEDSNGLVVEHTSEKRGKSNDRQLRLKFDSST